MEFFTKINVNDAHRIKDLLVENSIDFEFKKPETQHSQEYSVSLGRFSSDTSIELWCKKNDFEKINNLLFPEEVNREKYEEMYKDDLELNNQNSLTDYSDSNLKDKTTRRGATIYLIFVFALFILYLLIYLSYSIFSKS